MNTPMQPDKPQSPPQTSIKDRVFLTIKNKQVEPKSKYVFWFTNGMVWTLWLLTVLLGALATSVLLFTSTYRYYDIYEAMHDNFLTFFVQALPLLWILTLLILMALAIGGLRATRRGYKLSPLMIGGSSVGLSLLLGFTSSLFGFGLTVDQTLGAYAPMYYSQAEREAAMWQQPEEGRLLGRYVDTTNPDLVLFIDETGVEWQMDVAELRRIDRDILATADKVRVLGVQLDGTEAMFYACGVLTWMIDDKHSRKELQQQRLSWIERIYTNTTDVDDVSLAMDTTQPGEEPRKKVCAQIAAVRRISATME